MRQHTSIHIYTKRNFPGGELGLVLRVGRVYACKIPGSSGYTLKESEAARFADVQALRRHWHDYMPILVSANDQSPEILKMPFF